VIYWWANGLNREKLKKENKRIQFCSSKADIESYIGRELTEDEQNRV
jgi:hypothetical protein